MTVQDAIDTLLASGYEIGVRGSLVPPDSKQWVTPKEVSERPNTPSKRSLLRLCANGTLTSVLVGGRQKQYYINPDSLRRYMEAQERLIAEVDALTDGGLNDPSEAF